MKQRQIVCMSFLFSALVALPLSGQARADEINSAAPAEVEVDAAGMNAIDSVGMSRGGGHGGGGWNHGGGGFDHGGGGWNHGGGGFDHGGGGWGHGGYHPGPGFGRYPHWPHPFFPRPIYDWDWFRLTSVTCYAQDQEGRQYGVTEDSWGGYYQSRIALIEDEALDRCYAESGGDNACFLVGCNGTY